MLVGRTGLSPVMVGRAAELGRLTGLLGSSREPAVALVAGEAGIGKTRLIQELVGSLSPAAFVLAGQADPGTVGRPMELFTDSLRRTHLDEHSDLAAAVRDADRPADERVRAAVELVRALTAETGGLVVFEDLHWADSESLSVFEQLAEPDGGPLLLVGTYRPDGLSRRHPAADLLPRLERRHSVTHVHLGRLTPGDVSTFLAAVFDEDPSFRAVEALHSRTGGNPYFLEELVASAREPRGDDLESMPLPWSVAELVRSQLDALDPAVRAIVAAAAVVGRRVSFDVLAAVTRTGEADLIDLLRTAVDNGLLIETDPDVFSFHHDLAREAVETSLLGRERRRIHESALEALRHSGSRDHVAIVRHAWGAGRYEEMVEEARLGARESLRLGSTFQALQLAETGLSEAEDDLDLRSVATEAAWLADLLDDALEHADRWLARARLVGDTGQEAAALSLRMRIAYDIGDLAEMDALTEQLISIVDRLPNDEERARAMAFVAQSYMLRDAIDATVEWADKAHALAEANGLDTVRLAAMIEKGNVLVIDADSAEEGQELLCAAADEAEARGERVLAARAVINLVWRARLENRLDDARRLVARMQRNAEAAGFDSLASHARVEAMAIIAAADGDLDAAIGFLETGSSSDRDQRAHRDRRRWAVLRAGLALEACDLDKAARYTAEAKPATARSRVGVIGLDVHLASRMGDLAGARAALAELAEAVVDEGATFASQIHDIAAAGLAAGLTTEELRPFVEQVGVFAGNRLPVDHPMRRLLEAQLAEADGDLDGALAHYAAVTASGEEEATGVLARHRGTAHVGAARCLIALGRVDDARPHAIAAAGHLDRWRGWRVQELRAVERRLGIGGTPDGPTELTPREREVVSLLAEGLTNSQLAARLFISPRTAAVHVSNILAKLGMSSRTEVAAWAVREGLADG